MEFAVGMFLGDGLLAEGGDLFGGYKQVDRFRGMGKTGTSKVLEG